MTNSNEGYWHLFNEYGIVLPDADYREQCACAADWAQRAHDGEIGWGDESYNIDARLVAARSCDEVPYKLDWATLMSDAELNHIVEKYLDPMLAEIADLLRAKAAK